MRVPVNRLHGKARAREDTPEDLLVERLSKSYTVVRDKALEYTDEAGKRQTMIMDIAIPSQKLIVEIQKKQDTKSIMGEMAREKVARANGWRVCRLNERDAKSDDAFYFVKREIERGNR